MENLLNALSFADQVCKEATPHLASAQALRQQNAEQKAGKMKTAKIIAIVGGIFLCPLAVNLPMQLFLMLHLELVARVAAFPGLAAYIWFCVHSYKKYKNKVLSSMTALEKKARKEVSTGNSIISHKRDALAFLPEDYWFPMATEYLVKVVRTGRAADLNGALDLCDTYLHRCRLEESSARILEEQQAQSEALRSINTTSKINAAANAANAIGNMARNF